MTRKRRKPKGDQHPHEHPATIQTRARLTTDPLFLLLAGQDVSLEHAADEIYAVYTAICRAVMGKSPGFGVRVPGKGELTEEIAYYHAKTYLPWVQDTGRTAVNLLIGIIVDRHSLPWKPMEQAIKRALSDYARRMRERPNYSEYCLKQCGQTMSDARTP